MHILNFLANDGAEHLTYILCNVLPEIIGLLRQEPLVIESLNV
jgi:hypothetical protein